MAPHKVITIFIIVPDALSEPLRLDFICRTVIRRYLRYNWGYGEKLKPIIDKFPKDELPRTLKKFLAYEPWWLTRQSYFIYGNKSDVWQQAKFFAQFSERDFFHGTIPWTFYRTKSYVPSQVYYLYVHWNHLPSKPNFTYFDYYHLKVVREKIHPFASKSDFSSLLLVHISKEKKLMYFMNVLLYLM